ncbi:MAG: efflux RND transporter permease subunit [Mariprofundaceae bacterium]|nr:efflux RND transporter permease subunit [Mariprofundaceae bacterium]
MTNPTPLNPAPLNIAGKLGSMAMNSHVTPMLAILIFFIGVIALLLTPREENPQIDVPAANILVQMQGASPQEVENLVVRPLEMVLRGMTGVDHTFGMAQESMGIVTVMFKVGQDKEASLVKLYDKIMHNLDRMPAGAALPLIKPLDVDDVPVSVITLSSSDMDGLMLKSLAERVRDYLLPLDGVSIADIVGGRDRQLSITLDPTRMAAYHIALNQLHQTLASANQGGGVGTLVGAGKVQPIVLNAYLQSASEVGALIVGTWQGSAVYLRDIAIVQDTLTEVTAVHRIGFGSANVFNTANRRASQNDEPELAAVSITLAKKRGTNAVFVTQRIAEKLEQLKGDIIPDNVQVHITRDSGARANDAVNLLIEHLGIAIVSVIIILLFFLGWREAAIVTMNIPLILFTVLAVGLLADQTINRITLFALILSLGLLVDDAIVVIENIHRHLHHGVHTIKDKAAAIITATNETGKPTIIATIAVILAFIPMGFVTGMMGPYMGPIPFNTPVAMAASLVIAYMFTPWIAQRWLPCNVHEPSMDEKNESPKDWVHRGYLRLAEPLFNHAWLRWLFGVVVLLMFIAAMLEPAWQFIRPAGINGPMTTGSVELRMLPKGNNNTLNITLDMPEGTSLEGTDRVARAIGDILRRHRMVLDYEVFVGQAGSIDFNGMLRGAVLRKGVQLAEIRVNLLDKSKRHIRSAAIVLELREMLKPIMIHYPLANIKLVEDPPGPPVRATLLAEIYGPNEAGRQAVAKHVRETFKQTWDVVDIDDSIGADVQRWRIVLDREKASRLGISAMQLKQALRDFFQGWSMGALHIDDTRHSVSITVRLPREQRMQVSDLDRIYVSGTQGSVQLSSIARIKQETMPKARLTKDGHNVVYVMAEPKQGSQVYPVLAMDKQLDKYEVLPQQYLHTGGMRFVRSTPDDLFGYTLLWDGEMRLTLDVFRDLGSAFIVAMLLIYLLMVAYYGGVALPILVMAPTALTMIGIFPGHWITGQPFTATSMIGMIALAGIVVRNSTLLVDFILDYHARGYSARDAAMEAGAARTRPIILTGLAVIVGSGVMINDPVFGGLGVSMAFGTLASTALTLFIVPLVYYKIPFFQGNIVQKKQMR